MKKSPDAFRTISEVAELLETPAHVLRFWESRFPQIRPVKRAGGRRYYRPSDVDLLSGIRRLLHDDGLTIRGVQKILREQGVRHVSGIAEPEEDVVVPAALKKPQAGSVVKFPRSGAGKSLPPADGDLFSKDWATVTPAAPVTIKPAAPVADAAPVVDTAPVVASGSDKAEIATPAPKLPAQDPAPDAQPRREPAAPASAAATPTNDSPKDGSESDQDPADPQGDTINVFRDETPVAAPAPARAATARPAPARPAPIAAPPASEPEPITAHWLASDLRGLKPAALAKKRTQLAPLMLRLEQLRDRVADLGRVPRR